MKTRIAIVLIAAAAAAAYFLARGRGDERLEYYGVVEAQEIGVGSLTGGRVLSVLVEEGDSVAAGDTLVVLETDLVDLQITEQRARVAQAEAALAEAQAGARPEERERARIAWRAAETERKRLEALRSADGVDQRQLDGAVVNERLADASLREIEAGTRVERIRAAHAALAGEEGRLAYLTRQREEAVVRAPADGVVETLDLRGGDLVAAGQPVARVLEPGRLWARVYVPEPELALVAVGQGARLFVDAFPDRGFPGRVVEIRDRAEFTPRNVQTRDQRAEQVFGVKISVEPSPILKSGMAATVLLDPVPAAR